MRNILDYFQLKLRQTCRFQRCQIVLKVVLFSLTVLALLSLGDSTALGNFPGRRVILRNFFIPGQANPTADTSPPDPSPVLRWRSGETLKGELVQADEHSVSWRCAAFLDPLQIDWHVLDRIAWPNVTKEPAEPFCFSLADGSFLYGDLVSISSDVVEMKSVRHGDVQIKRSELLSIRRLHRGDLLLDGPCGEVGWRSVESGMNGFGAVFGSQDYTPPLATGPNGALLFRNWNRAAICNVTLPDKLDLSFKISSTERPEFLLALGAYLQNAVSLETWDNELVLKLNSEYKPVMKLDDSVRTLSLHILFDKVAAQCSIYKDDGTLIAEWDFPSNAPPVDPNLIVYNKGLNLSLDYLQIRAWDGKTIPTPIEQPSLQLSTGQRIVGKIESEALGSLTVTKAGDAAPTPVLLNDIDELVFQSPEPGLLQHNDSSLIYNDGASIYGHLTSVADGKATLNTSFTAAPLVSALDVPRRLTVRLAPFPTQKQDLDSMDKLDLGNGSLHGTVICSGGPSFRWNPVGGTTPSRLAEGMGFQLVKAASSSFTADANSALFYMSNGDVVPGKVGSISRDGVEFESTLANNRKFKTGDVNGIIFFSTSGYKLKGFDDPGWKILKGDSKSVHVDGNKLTLDPESSIDCPMEFKEFSFKYCTKTISGLKVHLFSSEKDDSKSLNIMIFSYGPQLYLYQEAEDGQGQQGQVQIAIKPGDDVPIKFRLNDNRLEVLVNGNSVLQTPVDNDECGGSKMILEPVSVFGNQTAACSMTDFSCIIGASWIPDFGAEVKKEMITLPRMSRKDPPTHLLVGQNGDLLRGELEAATDTTLQIRCGMETVDIPRERVKSIINLKPVDEKKAASDPSSDAVLDEKVKTLGQLRIGFGQIALSDLLNYLCSQWLGCTIHPPEKPIVSAITFSGQATVRAVLDRICAVYKVRYRVEKDSSITLESLDEVADLPSKSFWINPDKFPMTGDLQELLTSKGMTFPKGASVNLDSLSGLVTVSNTAENLTKFAGLMDSDLGGKLGTPTLWLLLANGGRMTLEAKDFSGDCVTGTNPLYGDCKIPNSEITSMSSSPFPASSETFSWRLVNAPEPVLPKEGATDSPLLGKAAPTFSADLLDGGKFDLASEKGKVVVLDFWATWCGPCTVALPGVIASVAALPNDKVELIGVDQGDPPDQINHFLQARGLKLKVALDPDQKIGTAYGVEGIPRTVVIGPDGTVILDQTGYDPDSEAALTDAIKKALSAPSDPPPPPADGKTPAAN